MTDLDCYIFEDHSVPIKTRTMSFICRECKMEHYSDTEMHLHCATDGYGPFTYKCCKCDCILHEESEEKEEEIDDIGEPVAE